MTPERLVALANPIGRFFDAQGDPDVVAARVRDHLLKFWDPRMRRELTAYVKAGGEGLTPAVERAVRALPEAS